MDVRPPMTASVEYERMYTCLKSAGCVLTLGSRLPWLVSALAEWLELSSAVHAGVNVLFRL